MIEDWATKWIQLDYEQCHKSSQNINSEHYFGYVVGHFLPIHSHDHIVIPIDQKLLLVMLTTPTENYFLKAHACFETETGHRFDLSRLQKNVLRIMLVTSKTLSKKLLIWISHLGNTCQWVVEASQAPRSFILSRTYASNPAKHCYLSFCLTSNKHMSQTYMPW